MGIVSLSTRRPVTIGMFTVALLIFGFVLLDRLGVNLLPNLSYPTLTIRTDYTGAAPAEVENLISKPIEEAVGVVKNVRQVRSISKAGQSDVLLEFNWGTDMGMAGIEVREKLDILQLPLDVNRPTLLRFNPSLDPILRFSLSKVETEEGVSNSLTQDKFDNGDFDESGLTYLRRFAEEEIKRQIESIEGVAAVKISGGLEDEVQVYIDQNKLAQYGMSINDVSQQLRAENVNLSGGRLEEGTQRFLVRTINQYQSVEEMADTIIKTIDGQPIYLKELAVVQQSYKERKSITRINGIESVEIAIYKEGDANTVQVAKNLATKLNRMERKFPADIDLDKTYDQSRFINQAIDEIIDGAIIGGLLAMMVLYLFLRRIGPTIIISLSIPISVIITFNFMYSMNISLNIMSLGGIALAIGLLVDNAIVVLENISRKREQGLGLIEAAQQGTSEVSSAITASTLTTVAVFLPLVFVEGIAGQLFSDQALTVTFALLASLGVALTLIPMLSSRNFEPRSLNDGLSFSTRTRWVDTSSSIILVDGVKILVKVFLWVCRLIFITAPTYLLIAFMYVYRGFSFIGGKTAVPAAGGFNKVFDSLAATYGRGLDWALEHKGKVVATAISLFVLSLVMVKQLGIELIPQLSQGEFIVELRAAPGTSIEQTDRLINKAKDMANGIPFIEKTYSVAGSGNRLDASPEKSGENVGELNVLMDREITREQEEQAVTELRKQLATIPGVQVKVDRPTLFSFKTPLEIEIRGYNLDQLKAVSQQLTLQLRQSDRFSDIKSTIEQGYPEVQVRFDHERLAKLGLQANEVAQLVSKKLKGEVATKFAFRERRIDVLVRVEEQSRLSVGDIKQLIINPQSERPIFLSAVASVEMGVGPSEINRLDQERVAIISSNFNYGALGEAAEEAQVIIDKTVMPVGIEAAVAGQNEEMEASFTSMQYALLLAVFLVYLVMASLFESLLHPFVILFSIPLALIGAVWALILTNTTVSVVVFIGLIMLAGIVVNNAIVLIDLINQLRQKGMEKIEAIKQAGRQRLRPIIMTTLTTALGMLPLAIGLGEGAEIRAPMAITLIGGLLVSTLLTLIVIPVIYQLLDFKQFENEQPIGGKQLAGAQSSDGNGDLGTLGTDGGKL